MDTAVSIAELVHLTIALSFFFGAFVFPLGCTVLIKFLEKS